MDSRRPHVAAGGMFAFGGGASKFRPLLQGKTEVIQRKLLLAGVVVKARHPGFSKEGDQ